jgi:hypothetical protein
VRTGSSGEERKSATGRGKTNAPAPLCYHRIMKVFISSLIAGMKPLRQAARVAVTTLRHEPLMAEDFGAQPLPPQIACLTGVRQADLVILILGESYGTIQPSGLSATHEEYREARGRKPILAFVQRGIQPDARQKEFLDEVQSWESGLFREGFSAAEDLQTSITRALHDHELATAVGPVDQEDITARAAAALPFEERGYHSGTAALMLAVAGGPRQPILRPQEIENPSLAEGMHQELMFGQARLFDPKKGTDTQLDGGTLVLTQERDGARITLDEQGTVALRLPLTPPEKDYGFSALIEEDIHQRIMVALQYAVWLLDRVDPTQRLSHVAIAARIAASDYTGWQTRQQQDTNPRRVAASGRGGGSEPVQISRTRPALRLEAGPLAQDLLVLLRRQWKD